MKRNYIKLILGIIVLLFLLPSAVGAETTDEVRHYLENYYVDEVPAEVLEKQTAEEMLESLDRYSNYMTADEYQQFLDSLELSYSGIGVAINESEYGIEIMTVFQDSPAEKAGIQAGDHVTEVEGESIAGLTLEVIVSRIRGEAGTTVEITIFRPSTDEKLEMVVERNQISMPTVEHMELKGNIGYIRLYSFNSDAVNQMKVAINELPDVDGWIVDLRNNPGGYLGAAQEVAGLFPNVDQALMVKSNDGESTVYNAMAQDVQFKGPVKLLINQSSASASEIVAAAVKEQNGATLYGQRSFGKGTMQSLFTLENGDVLKLTTARFYSPEGQPIHEVGVEPDVATSIGFEIEYALKDLLLDQLPRFKDSSHYVWAEEAIEVMGKMEIINGKSAELFDPSSSITRAEFAVLISRMFNLEADNNELPFEDVPAEEWYSNGVAAAYANGLIEGKSASTFDPKGDITREEIATIVARVLTLLGYEASDDVSLTRYDDADMIATWAKDSVKLMEKEGIMTGVSETAFAPKKQTTRAQAAVILYRLFYK
jgi:carboxyl-terminal processing protease